MSSEYGGDSKVAALTLNRGTTPRWNGVEGNATNEFTICKHELLKDFTNEAPVSQDDDAFYTNFLYQLNTTGYFGCSVDPQTLPYQKTSAPDKTWMPYNDSIQYLNGPEHLGVDQIQEPKVPVEFQWLKELQPNEFQALLAQANAEVAANHTGSADTTPQDDLGRPQLLVCDPENGGASPAAGKEEGVAGSKVDSTPAVPEESKAPNLDCELGVVKTENGELPGTDSEEKNSDLQSLLLGTLNESRKYLELDPNSPDTGLPFFLPGSSFKKPATYAHSTKDGVTKHLATANMEMCQWDVLSHSMRRKYTVLQDEAMSLGKWKEWLRTWTRTVEEQTILSMTADRIENSELRTYVLYCLAAKAKYIVVRAPHLQEKYIYGGKREVKTGAERKPYKTRVYKNNAQPTEEAVFQHPSTEKSTECALAEQPVIPSSLRKPRGSYQKKKDVEPQAPKAGSSTRTPVPETATSSAARSSTQTKSFTTTKARTNKRKNTVEVTEGETRPSKKARRSRANDPDVAPRSDEEALDPTILDDDSITIGLTSDGAPSPISVDSPGPETPPAEEGFEVAHSESEAAPICQDYQPEPPWMESGSSFFEDEDAFEIEEFFNFDAYEE